jgi:ABC-type lipoprotein export system ATPase subunit
MSKGFVTREPLPRGTAATGSRLGAAIDVRGLRHAYATSNGPVEVLRDVNLAVPVGARCALQGPSGVGKTTLLAILGGLISSQAGAVRIGPSDVSSLRGDELAQYRRHTVGFVFQHFGLLEALTALENVELAAALAGGSRNRRRALARELLAAVGLRNRGGHRPGQLSGGERQRVAIARSLMNRPALLLADEPTGNLDEESAVGVIDLLERLQREWGFTMLVATHNDTIAGRASQRTRLTNGCLVPM